MSKVRRVCKWLMRFQACGFRLSEAAAGLTRALAARSTTVASASFGSPRQDGNGRNLIPGISLPGHHLSGGRPDVVRPVRHVTLTTPLLPAPVVDRARSRLFGLRSSHTVSRVSAAPLSFALGAAATLPPGALLTPWPFAPRPPAAPPGGAGPPWRTPTSPSRLPSRLPRLLDVSGLPPPSSWRGGPEPLQEPLLDGILRRRGDAPAAARLLV
mmetsp:Transcript_26881/g.62402  ORF Transcript_26881/g.62402 Transcript_26881/m.62402 type:complete len:213 (-) Transcript_26881:507-1145(-)